MLFNQSFAALTERQALADYPSTARCRLSEGQEWLDSLRSETRLTTRCGWRGRVRLCDSAAASDGTGVGTAVGTCDGLGVGKSVVGNDVGTGVGLNVRDGGHVSPVGAGVVGRAVG